MAIIQGNSAVEKTGGYEIPNSLKFNSADSAYLSWTPASAGNRKTWTWSAWVKRSGLSSNQCLFSCRNSDWTAINFDSSNSISVSTVISGVDTIELLTSSLYRDVSAWYHIILAVDTTQATASNRVKLYVNGSQVTSFSTATYPSQNSDTFVNTTNQHLIGQFAVTSRLLDGYISEVNFIDGQALDPTSFGEYNSETGVWQPIAYAGTYGTNGFYLPMTQDQIVEGFNTVLWRGNGGTQRITGVGFNPDLIWIKNRDSSDPDQSYHNIFDSVRGINARLYPNATNAEESGYLTSFDADGFTMTTSNPNANANGVRYVGWCWDAGNSTVSNTDGTITSTVRASQTYGFSVVTYTGNGSAGATIGHGLGTAPSLVIVKSRSLVDGWLVYSSALGATKYLVLSSTNAAGTLTAAWNDTAPTSSVFSVGTNSAVNQSSATYVAYCFAETGYSKFGSYTGNGSSTGPTVTLGWRPAFVMVKNTSNAAGWMILDNTRDTVNNVDKSLYANSSSAESTGDDVEFTDTGFQIKNTYGTANTNGDTYIYAAFKDQREAAFWRDFSGNGNHWQPNNLDFNDSVVDVPTNYGTDTGVGAEVRGNYATLNPLDNGGLTLTNGNLNGTKSGTNWFLCRATQGVSSGKWYFEGTFTQGGTPNSTQIGICGSTSSLSNYLGAGADAYSYGDGAYKYNNNSGVAYGASYTTGDVIGVAFDLDAGTITFYKNGTSQGQAYSGLSGTFFPAIDSWNGSAWVLNFGQRPFAYTAPSGFKALCTQNLPEPTVVDGGEYFNTVLYTGNGSTQSITGVGFQPDWTWLKNRADGTDDHQLYDVIRTAGKLLKSNTTGAEATVTDGLTSFNSDGFSVGSSHAVNASGQGIVAWNWKAGGAGVSNTDGTITSTVSANTTAGFSIVTYTGDGASGSTVGHGLGVKPDMIIVKNRDSALDWHVWHSGMDSTGEYFLFLNSTSAATTYSYAYLASNSSTFTPQGNTKVNGSGANMLAYCFSAVSGYSAFGSYTGSGATDGSFIYTGFRPAFVMVKAYIGSGENWGIYDNKRDGYNIQNKLLYPNLSNAENAATNHIDLLSNGFKFRSGNNDLSGYSYIYAAFAENPFKYALAR